MPVRFLTLFLLVAAITVCCAQVRVPESSSLTTSDRLEESSWWPTKGAAPRAQYVGGETCTVCHGAIARAQATTPMFHASVRAPQSEILSTHDKLDFQQDKLQYSLLRTPAGVSFTVGDGSESRTASATWAFGAGEIGQTYILQQGSALLESRLSYFTRLGSLDITIGHSAHPPTTVESGFGHELKAESAQQCFSCHTTGAVTANVFAPDQAIAGIRCEACHGPGARHVAAMKAQQFKPASVAIMNPAHLAPSDSVDFCGACHRTWADVVMQSSPMGIGINTVRFQPYLLENSRCWGNNGDARLTCIACHNPHQPLVREAKAYDVKCLACHSSGTTCKVGKSACVACHMPKYELPQSHATFTDHTIRIVRAATSASPGH